MATASIGTVPRAWLTVLRLAVRARPGLAISGLWAAARGKRVRGWNRLSLAAAAHPGCYAAWIKATEPTLMPVAHGIAPGLIGAILIGDGDAAATRASLNKAFGVGTPILDASAALPATDRPAWLLPIRVGDLVSPSLGAVLAKTISVCNTRLIYWDEDRQTSQSRTAPWVKPDWDPLLFQAHDGLIGSCLLRADAVRDLPVADWPALARGVAGVSPAPLHVPLILTHRAAARVAAVPARAAAPPVSVSVVIPTRDRAELLETCIDGLARTDFPGDRDVIVVDNGSTEPRTKILFDRLVATGQARIVPQPGPFNFAALSNAGVAVARSDLVCLLNNDIEIVAPDWLERMTTLAIRDEIGAVGARLTYPDGVIQHAGVALGIGGAAGHVAKGAMPVPGEFAPWHGETRTVSAVTAACLLVARAKFDAVGGMDAEGFAIDFNDVDLCLRLAASGWHSVYCAQATLVHHESRSRGTTRNGEDLARFERELAALRMRWGTRTIVDPYHSTLFRRHSEPCLLAF